MKTYIGYSARMGFVHVRINDAFAPPLVEYTPLVADTLWEALEEVPETAEGFDKLTLTATGDKFPVNYPDIRLHYELEVK